MDAFLETVASGLHASSTTAPTSPWNIRVIFNLLGDVLGSVYPLQKQDFQRALRNHEAATAAATRQQPHVSASPNAANLDICELALMVSFLLGASRHVNAKKKVKHLDSLKGFELAVRKLMHKNTLQRPDFSVYTHTVQLIPSAGQAP